MSILLTLRVFLAASLLFITVCSEAAVPRVAVLEFELNDLSLLPGTQQELQRTQAVAPILRETLAEKGHYALVAVTPEQQQRANAGAGYLATHSDSAAALGREVGADWIVVGRLQKSNDLFAYLTVNLIDVHTARTIGRLNTEIKGPVASDKLTRRGIQRLAFQIDSLISGQSR